MFRMGDVAMRWLAQGAVVLAAVGLAGCAAKSRVRSEYDRSFDFAHHHAYDWDSAPPELPPGSEKERQGLAANIHAAIAAELAAKGYQQLPNGQPDMLVRYRLRVKEVAVNTFQDYYEYFQAGGAEGPQEAYAFGYLQGTLIVEFVEPSSQRLLWRSAVFVAVEPKGQTASIQEGVRQLLEHFPPM